jgi:KipI family sensor histidine kinase inhibitor
MTFPLYQAAGDRAVLISYEERIDLEINKRCRALVAALAHSGLSWFEEAVFSYRSVLVIYQPGRIHFPEAVAAIKKVEQNLVESPETASKLFEIPTVYGGPYGMDLESVAAITGLRSPEVVELYASTRFTVYFTGFLCGQPYLGGLPEKLRVPRLNNPRTHVPAGSVGIGGIQASLITIDQPSGHRFIGKTPLSSYDPLRIPPTPFNAGDQVIFKPATAEEASRWNGKTPVGRS